MSLSCHSRSLLYSYGRDFNKTILLFFLEIPLSYIFQVPLLLAMAMFEFLPTQVMTESDECAWHMKLLLGTSRFFLGLRWDVHADKALRAAHHGKCMGPRMAT